MVQTTTAVLEKEEAPGAPPLFVTAFSSAGERMEALVESGAGEPKWLDSASQLRIQTPGGRAWDGRVDHKSKESFYDTLLAQVGGKTRAWASTVFDETTSISLLKEAVNGVEKLELWTTRAGEASVSNGPLFVLQDGVLPGPGEPPAFAVVRRTDHSVVYVPNAERFYIDILPSARGSEAVPRAVVDTGLAGAFWGYTEHQIPAASRVVADRLLGAIKRGDVHSLTPAWIAASAHAVLSYRELLPMHGDRVAELLRSGIVPEPDASLLGALIKMALAEPGSPADKALVDDVRGAVALLATKRVTYGETLRWLDNRFEALRQTARMGADDPKLEIELNTIADWLGRSYIGGQIAAYAGEAPMEGKGWHDALAEKKTSQLS